MYPRQETLYEGESISREKHMHGGRTERWALGEVRPMDKALKRGGQASSIL